MTQPAFILRNVAKSYSRGEQAVAIFEEMVGAVTRHLKKGSKVRINGLGTLQIRKRAARMGRNPRTGEPVKIKASKKVAFRVAKELKEVI